MATSIDRFQEFCRMVRESYLDLDCQEMYPETQNTVRGDHLSNSFHVFRIFRLKRTPRLQLCRLIIIETIEPTPTPMGMYRHFIRPSVSFTYHGTKEEMAEKAEIAWTTRINVNSPEWRSALEKAIAQGPGYLYFFKDIPAWAQMKALDLYGRKVVDKISDPADEVMEKYGHLFDLADAGII